MNTKEKSHTAVPSEEPVANSGFRKFWRGTEGPKDTTDQHVHPALDRICPTDCAIEDQSIAIFPPDVVKSYSGQVGHISKSNGLEKVIGGFSSFFREEIVLLPR